MREKLEAAIQNSQLLAPGDAVLVAVSGGPDSVALLHVLYGLRDELGLSLHVAHLQHGIRGAAAEEDARFVGRLADELNLPFHVRGLNLLNVQAEAGKGNLEQLARAERYKFFAAVAVERGLTKIATAHTQDDQAETVLMWLMRGCGLRGLGGMAPLRPQSVPEAGPGKQAWIIRPFLRISKAEILQYLQESGLSYRRDATNSDPVPLRNWIRLVLMPSLKAKAGGHFPARLSRQAELLRDENDYMDRVAHRELQTISRPGGLDRLEFLRQDRAMQRRMLRVWVEQTRGHLRGIDYVHVEQLVKLVAFGPPQARLPIPGGWELLTEYDIVKLQKRQAGGAEISYSYELQIGERLQLLEAGMEMISEYLAAPLAAFPETLHQAVFDAAGLCGTLSVRNYRRGDRFQPIGLSGHKKVKDLFIEKKVPRSLRRRLPLLLAGQDILWIPGYSRSDIAKISAETRKIARVTAIPLGS